MAEAMPLATTYATTIIITIRADAGTSIAALIISPPRLHTRDIITERPIMELKRWVNISATSCGSTNMDISSITPTSFMVSTMATATKAVME